MAPTNNSFSDLVDYIVAGELDEPVSWSKTTLTYNLDGLSDPEMRQAASDAFAVWSTVTGFVFEEAAKADIPLYDKSNGAYTDLSWRGETIVKTAIYVPTDWMDGFPADERWGVGDYGFQTFVHEIGHALGLNHPGPYDGSGDYEDDAIFVKDTEQYSIMSYFEQDEFGDATDLNVATPMIADIAAIRKLYPNLEANPGNTTYGRSGAYDFGAVPDAGYTIADTSGARDLIDLRGLDEGARLDLRAGAFSDIGGNVKNLAIAYDTVIERALGTKASDAITGNAAANVLRGLGGDDRLIGGGGADVLEGGAGADTLKGGVGADTFRYLRASEIDGDVILDFKSGVDDIDLSRIDADTSRRGAQDFTFIERAAFDGEAGQLRYALSSKATVLTADLDGDGKADFSLRLEGRIALTADDLIL